LNKLIYRFLGAALIIFGSFRTIRQGYHDALYHYNIDFGPYHYLLGIMIVTVGVMLLLFSFKKPIKSSKDKLLICPKCQNPYKREHLNQGRCVACGTELEELVGFYERHPELGKSKQKESNKGAE
jgi:hypothetical protein